MISGAIPNAETPSRVRDENQTQVRLVSGSGVKSEKSLTFECGDSCTIVHGDEFSRVNGQERSIVEGDWSAT